MNPQQQRIALAEWEGWTKIDAVPSRPWGFPPEGQPYIFSPLPDYLSDLNAVHELEERLDFSAQAKYSHWLWDNVVNKRDTLKTYDWFAHIHTSATLRCEALLKTLGLWKD